MATALVRAPITHRVRIATPAPASALTTARRTLQIIDMREAAKKAEPKPVGTKDPLVECELEKVIDSKVLRNHIINLKLDFFF